MSPKKSPGKRAEKPGLTVIPIRCVACGKWGALQLPGPAPWAGAIFVEKDWTVLNETEEGHVVFTCGKCFEEEVNKPDSKIHGEG